VFSEKNAEGTVKVLLPMVIKITNNKVKSHRLENFLKDFLMVFIQFINNLNFND
jgi:hypothetical protein